MTGELLPQQLVVKLVDVGCRTVSRCCPYIGQREQPMSDVGRQTGCTPPSCGIDLIAACRVTSQVKMNQCCVRCLLPTSEGGRTTDGANHEMSEMRFDKSFSSRLARLWDGKFCHVMPSGSGTGLLLWTGPQHRRSA